MYDVIAIGGATLDIFLDIHEATKHYRITKDESGEWVSFKKGEKVPLDSLHFDVGGNATNVAVGLARLGVSAATHIHYGDDEISQKIINVLQKESVGTEFAIEDKGQTSPVSIIINAAGDRTLFVHHIVRDHVLPAISVPKWMYLTSVGERWKNLYQQVVDFVTANNVKLAFNPGSHQMESGVDSFIEQVKASYALFVNREEAGTIADGISHMANSGQKDLKTILTQLQSLGPKIVSITDGRNGSFAIDEKGAMYQLGIFPATVLERTGAGDSYAAGFLAALIHGLPVNEAMRWGAINAASVVSTVGAEKGLLHKEEIEQKLAENSDFTAQPLQ